VNLDPRLGFHPDAVAEARGAARWYRERNADASGAFLTELERALLRIAEAPERWPAIESGRRRFVLRRFPFSIVYRVQSDQVEVLAVAHGRRRPGYWRDR
jgi:plasmid stabilization system protein ParE